VYLRPNPNHILIRLRGYFCRTLYMDAMCTGISVCSEASSPLSTFSRTGKRRTKIRTVRVYNEYAHCIYACYCRHARLLPPMYSGVRKHETCFIQTCEIKRSANVVIYNSTVCRTYFFRFYWISRVTFPECYVLLAEV